MIKALESYLKEDHEALTKEWWRRLDSISTEVTKVPGVSTSFSVPDIANHVPHLEIHWDPRLIVLEAGDAVKQLRSGRPSIVVASNESGLIMNSFMLQPGEEKIMGERLTQFFRGHTV
jgi:D-glucosaminate-6-phosphate ammonia-lyase